MLLKITNESISKRLRKRNVKETHPQYKDIVRAAIAELREEIPHCVDKCITEAIRAPNLNRGELKEGMYFKDREEVWKVIFAGKGYARVKKVSTKVTETKNISLRSEVEIINIG